MFQLKLEVTGEIGLYREGMREIKKIPRKEMKEKIESEMQYPGTVKIIVIRESRAQEEAK